MSDSEKQSLSLKEKDGVEKRGRGRPRKHPKESSGSPVPKRPRGRPKGSKNKGPAKKRAVSSSGKKLKGKPKKELHHVVFAVHSRKRKIRHLRSPQRKTRRTKMRSSSCLVLSTTSRHST